MDDRVVLMLEEYKSLRSEASSYSDISYRTLEFLAALLAAIALFYEKIVPSFQLLVTGDKVNTVTFIALAFGQLALFLIGLVQLSRIAYLLQINFRLVVLENKMNEIVRGELAWEHIIGEQRRRVNSSASSLSQFVLTVVYGLILIAAVVLSVYSSFKIGPCELAVPYLLLVIAEMWTMIHLAIKLFKELKRPQETG